MVRIRRCVRTVVCRNLRECLGTNNRVAISLGGCSGEEQGIAATVAMLTAGRIRNCPNLFKVASIVVLVESIDLPVVKQNLRQCMRMTRTITVLDRVSPCSLNSVAILRRTPQVDHTLVISVHPPVDPRAVEGISLFHSWRHFLSLG